MLEMRLHGRGGQGTVVATEILAKAAFKEGKFVQAFPFFGVERRGAPVTAFARVDDKKIWIKTQIYEPDIIVVLDPLLLEAVDVFRGLKPGGKVLINVPEGTPLTRPRDDIRVATVDATAIALKRGLGSKALPIVNTSILGAIARVTDIASFDAILACIGENIGIKTDLNIESAQEAYDVTDWKDLPVRKATPAGKKAKKAVPEGERELEMLPYSLMSSKENKTGAWRLIKPVLDADKCTGCLLCWKFCPEACITVADGLPVVDLDYCKGCGICEAECPKGAIAMVAEEKSISTG